jgi:hypothetical protein
VVSVTVLASIVSVVIASLPMSLKSIASALLVSHVGARLAACLPFYIE